MPFFHTKTSGSGQRSFSFTRLQLSGTNTLFWTVVLPLPVLYFILLLVPLPPLFFFFFLQMCASLCVYVALETGTYAKSHFVSSRIHQIRIEIMESHAGNGMCLKNNLNNTMTMFAFLFQFQSSQCCRPLPITKHFYNSFINAEVHTKSIMAYSHSQSMNYEGF